MKILVKFGLPIIIVIIICIFGIINPVFVSAGNLINLLDQISIIGLISLGMTLVILIGGIDLSVGSIVALTGIVFALSLQARIPLIACILITFTTGCLFGIINGFFITYGKVPPFIATLGSMSIARGIALSLTDGRSIAGLDDRLSYLSASNESSIPVGIIMLLLSTLIFWLFLRHTYWGRFMFAIGGNERAAWLSGLKTARYKIFAYAVSGLMSAIGCVLLVTKLHSAQPQAGNLYELNSIAAVVIGGASLSGGKASITGTFFGVLILGILQNGFSILNIPSYYQQILVGLIVIGAVFIDAKISKKNQTI